MGELGLNADGNDIASPCCFESCAKGVMKTSNVALHVVRGDRSDQSIWVRLMASSAAAAKGGGIASDRPDHEGWELCLLPAMRKKRNQSE